MPHLPADVGFELVKLMMQVAFSDDELSEEEAGFVRGLAAQLQLGPAEVASVEQSINQTETLPAPNLGLLKAHGETVMRTAAGLMVADGKVVEDERDMIQQLSSLLT